MASKTFEVKEYRAALHREHEVYGGGAMVRCTGRVLCMGRPRGAATDFRLHILFIPAGAPAPPNTTDFAANEARLYLREDRLDTVLALLHSGESVYAYVSDTHPLSNQIRTSFEPLDES
jgi:hypothetical protein